MQDRPWTVYDLFATRNGTQLFFGIVGDTQWVDFCKAFDKPDWLADPRLQNNGDRTAARRDHHPLPTVTGAGGPGHGRG